MITIYAPDNYISEREYIFNVVFSYFLGIDYTIKFESNKNNVVISGKNGYIHIEDVLFALEDKEWLGPKCLPQLPLAKAVFDNQGVFHINDLPVIFGNVLDSGNFFNAGSKCISLGIDIFGSAFFMLTRLEEYIVTDRDEHDRFPVESSIAYREGFLDRPIINEYIELLWCLVKQIEPSLERRERKYEVLPTHDIDNPFGMMFESPLQVSRHFAGDVLYRKSLSAVLKRIQEIIQCLCFKKQYMEKYRETYEFIDAESRKHCLKDVFFFMNSKKSWYDGNYTIDEPYVLRLIEWLTSKGYNIGLHPSFDSYIDGDEIKREFVYVQRVFSDNHLPSPVGARQHYLKWKNPDTWQHYEDAKIPIDSSMCYAGCVGFRCGVCYPYPVYNIKTRKMLKLIEHPLIVMDKTLYGYMKLSYDEALPIIKKLANECKKYNGEFVILWHNTVLNNEDERSFYSKMLDEVCSE